jgi:hypothetical protein
VNGVGEEVVDIRHLAAQFLEVVGLHVVAVDRTQPVAATVSLAGEVRDVVSWAGAVSPPPAAAWPNRRIGVQGDRIVVQDLPDGQLVAVTVSPDGSLAATPARDEPAVTWRYPRLLGAIPRSVGSWEFTTQRDGYRLTAEVAHGGTWSAGRGSIVAHAVLGDVAVVAIRRADVRPWVFGPLHELVLLDGRSAAPKPSRLASIDISDRCWSSPRADGVPLLGDYLKYTFGQVAALRERGGRDVRVHVAGFDADLVIEMEFGLDTAPAKRFVRYDEPFDEFGNVAGLAFWNIIFDDERFDLLAEGPEDDQGRIVV